MMSYIFNILISVMLLLHVCATCACAYVDPGTQGMVVQMIGAFVGLLGMALSLLLMPVKRVWYGAKSLLGRPRYLKMSVVLVLICSAFVLTAYNKKQPEEIVGVIDRESEVSERVIVLGMDGLDPELLSEMMGQGELPNFTRLRDLGHYSELQTTIPPETPVAWSAIATGCNPGKFGIYDFLHREAETYLPNLSIYKVNSSNVLDKREKRFLPVRKAPGVWSYVTDAGLPATVLRWPTAFPAEEVSGQFLSGLGVPDLSGRLGRYSLYTTEPAPADTGKFKGHWRYAPWQGTRFQHQLYGPKTAGLTGIKETSIDLLVEKVDAETVSLKLGEEVATLKKGRWSEYLPVRFKASLGKQVPGMVRAYLVDLEPHLRLYVSTVEVDPMEPYFPITAPDGYSQELAQAVGRYTTLGMPEDVNAMKDGSLPPAAFEEAMNLLHEERVRQFTFELERFEKGLFAFVFDAGDRIQHMYWRTRDVAHPNYDREFATAFAHVIPNMYRQMDAVLGMAMETMDEKTTIMVVSDHGFAHFHREVGLNSWLVRNGYMVLNSPDGSSGEAMFADVDWSRTRAYSLGFCSVYLNQRGRERDGIVPPGEESLQLQEEIAARLRGLVDPTTGHSAVRNVYLGTQVYDGEFAADAPDLVVGFDRGYRANDMSALGAAPIEVFTDNTSLWSGDHLMDPDVVPGVLLSNRKVMSMRPRGIDIAPSVLEALGVQPPATMDGQSLFRQGL